MYNAIIVRIGYKSACLNHSFCFQSGLDSFMNSRTVRNMFIFWKSQVCFRTVVFLHSKRMIRKHTPLVYLNRKVLTECHEKKAVLLPETRYT